MLRVHKMSLQQIFHLELFESVWDLCPILIYSCIYGGLENLPGMEILTRMELCVGSPAESHHTCVPCCHHQNPWCWSIIVPEELEFI